MDMIEYALAEARRTGGQAAVDKLTQRMARERVSCLTSIIKIITIILVSAGYASGCECVLCQILSMV